MKIQKFYVFMIECDFITTRLLIARIRLEHTHDVTSLTLGIIVSRVERLLSNSNKGKHPPISDASIFEISHLVTCLLMGSL